MAGESGKTGRVKVGTSFLRGSDWSADISVDVDDTTSFESGGWQENTPGVLSVSNGKITLNAKSTEDIHSASINLVPGQFVAMELTAYNNPSTSVTRKYTGTALIETVSPQVGVRGAVKYNISFRGDGPWTLPTG